MLQRWLHISGEKSSGMPSHSEMRLSLTKWGPWWWRIVESQSENLLMKYASVFNSFIPFRRVWTWEESQWSLYHSFICVVLIASSMKAWWILLIISTWTTKLYIKFDAVVSFKFSVILLKKQKSDGTHLHILTCWWCGLPPTGSFCRWEKFTHVY